MEVGISRIELEEVVNERSLLLLSATSLRRALLALQVAHLSARKDLQATPRSRSWTSAHILLGRGSLLLP